MWLYRGIFYRTKCWGISPPALVLAPPVTMVTLLYTVNIMHKSEEQYFVIDRVKKTQPPGTH